jgi:hypothetical protein
VSEVGRYYDTTHQTLRISKWAYIYSKLRSKLSADYVNELSCLNNWMNLYRDSCNSSENILCAKRNDRFASLSLELELEVGPESDDENEEEDKEL